MTDLAHHNPWRRIRRLSANIPLSTANHCQSDFLAFGRGGGKGSSPLFNSMIHAGGQPEAFDSFSRRVLEPERKKKKKKRKSYLSLSKSTHAVLPSFSVLLLLLHREIDNLTTPQGKLRDRGCLSDSTLAILDSVDTQPSSQGSL